MEAPSEITFGDTTIRFPFEAATDSVGMELVPTTMVGDVVPHRISLRGMPEIDAIPDAGDPPASPVDSLVHLKIVGDPYPGAFAQGRTMRNAPTVRRFKFVSRNVNRRDDRTVVLTELRSDDGCRVEHLISWHDGDLAATVTNSFVNGSQQPVALEMLTSFSLGGITPFADLDAPGRLRVHRFRSVWSAEGRLDTQSIEQLHLERSWSGAGAFSERFGQVGSMPVRGWFPFVAVEDTVAGVCWGAQLAWAGSWQMEIFRQHDHVCISGGLADREFGHWLKTVRPGETFQAPPATVACVRGNLDDLCDRLTTAQQRAADAQPAVERDLPIVFNEWCTTWGDPGHDKLLAIADRLEGSLVKYIVIDAGWYKTDQGNWDNGHGDWVPSRKLFPDGLAATAKAIRERGFIPGLWFEMETVGERSTSFGMIDHLLKRDGIPITVRSRRFWDLNDPVSVDFLAERVVDLLEQCGFGYLKVDYNETIGLGCDGAESQGEGLRLQIEGVYRFFNLIRHRLPELVIENCSSGGHRLEPSMIGRTAMSSFSDAHELREIPIIAANLHRLMLPRQSQIWAVLHRTDSDQRLVYSLAATFLGRMCLSGEIDQLSAGQTEIVRRAQELYRKAVPIIRRGVSRRFGEVGESWRHPRGWQGVVRQSEDGGQLLVVVHTFAETPGVVQIPLPEGEWHVVEEFSSAARASTAMEKRMLEIPSVVEFEGRVVLLNR